MGANISFAPDTVRPALDAIRRLVRTLRTGNADAERATGLSSAQLFVLSLLDEAPADSMNELAERTFTDQSSVSVVVSRLEARGLVARTHSRRDARRTGVRLTGSGAALLHHAGPSTPIRLVAALTALGPHDAAQLASLLGRVNDALGASGDPPPLLFDDDATGAR